jgi:hypothetical protein
MRAAILALWMVASLASMAAIGSAGARALHAREVAFAASQTLELVSRLASDIASLKSGTAALPRISTGGPAMGTRIADVLAAAGLQSTTLSNVSPEADTRLQLPDSSQRFVRSRVTLSLNEITLPSLGLFLDAWRRTEPDWVPASIDVTPTSPKQGFPGGDLPLNVIISLEAVFADAPGGTR